MAPSVPKKRRSSDSDPSKRAAVSGHGKRSAIVLDPSPNAKRPAVVRKQQSAASAALAKKQANAVQVPISFGAVDKYPVGLKILLDDSIYLDGVSLYLIVCFLFEECKL
jgi:hypothetical protein